MVNYKDSYLVSITRVFDRTLISVYDFIVNMDKNDW